MEVGTVLGIVSAIIALFAVVFSVFSNNANKKNGLMEAFLNYKKSKECWQIFLLIESGELEDYMKGDGKNKLITQSEVLSNFDYYLAYLDVLCRLKKKMFGVGDLINNDIEILKNDKYVMEVLKQYNGADNKTNKTKNYE